MAYRVLGPLSVRRDGAEPVRVTGKPRRLLALLLLNQPHLVPAGALVAELWDDPPPVRAPATLQAHVSHLRAELARGLGVPRELVAGQVLRTGAGGYGLSLGGAAYDLPEFRRLRAAGEARLGAGDPAGAVAVLAEALALWRGPALADVDPGRLLAAAVAELDRSRVDTLALFLGAQLDLGRHREVSGELAGLVVRHPLHEPLHAHFMVALHRSGRRTRALAVFDRLRQALHEELGAAPSPGTVRVWQEVRGTPSGRGTRVGTSW